MSTNSVLVIAFDGLDRELIEEFGLKHVKQEEFGALDNNTGMHQIKTSELFTSFITGKTWEDHGITGHEKRKYQNPMKDKILRFLTPDKIVANVRGWRTLREVLESVMRAEKLERYTKNDQKLDTLFEKISGSRAMFVPGYNPGMIWRLRLEIAPLENGYSVERRSKFWDKRSYEVRKRDLFREIENDIVSPRPFLMCHFFRPDQHQHYYGDIDLGTYNKDKLRKMYLEIDELAGEIREKALEKGYDTIIFMSDHGLPDETDHNENAFYSCNRKLFGKRTPKITDFHDKILEAQNS
ncbi:hypothetical protein GLU60_04100 [Nanohaloarchaea archaeon H01]|nr:hypothetical protein [Nanohaloarchaea archaeon H01]